MSQAPKRQLFRPDIEGLRGIAVLVVICFHAGVKTLSGGFTGVDIFFVISGYLIGAHIYADTSRGSFSIAEFYRKRAKRILPALLVMLVVVLVVGLFVLVPYELDSLGQYIRATVLSLSNIRASRAVGYFGAPAAETPLLMTWSLGVEEQFYIFCPLVLLALGRHSRRWVMAVLASVIVLSLAACVYISFHTQIQAFYLLPYRAWELVSGVLLAVYESGREDRPLISERLANPLGALGMAMILLAVFRFSSDTIFPGYAALLPIGGALLLLMSSRSWISRNVLSQRPLRFLGAISYSLYLWHWPMLAFARLAHPSPTSLAENCALVLCAVPIGWLSYRFVEQPFRNSRTPRRTLLLRYAYCCALMLVSGVVIRETHGLPQRFRHSPELLMTPAALNGSCALDGTDSLPYDNKACMDKQDPREAVALLGDSHAEAMAVTLQQMSDHAGYKFYQFFKYGCPAIQHASLNAGFTPGGALQPDCVAFNTNVLRLVESDPKIKIVVLSSYWAHPDVNGTRFVRAGETTPSTLAGSDQNLVRSLSEEIVALQAAGKQVVILGDVPVFAFDTRKAIYAETIRLRSLLAFGHFPQANAQVSATLLEAHQPQEARTAALLERIAAPFGVRVIDVRHPLCDATSCSYVRNGKMLYIDADHVTNEGAAIALANASIFAR